MSREVDIKALVSHIVLGNGMDKCRICMGDTTDGQVYLGDTVMTEGDRPVTLGDLLEILTGVEMESLPGLPNGICRECSEGTMSAIKFRQLCKVSIEHWECATNFLTEINEPSTEDKAYYVFYTEEAQTVLRDQIGRVNNVTEAVERLKGYLENIRKPKKKKSNSLLSFFCPDCGKNFSLPSYLNSHLKTTMKRACTVCGCVLPKSQLAKHMIKTHNSVIYSCKVCYELFPDQKSVLRHKKKVHHPNRHNCTTCWNSFVNIRALNTHMYSHTLFHCRCRQSFDNMKCFKYHQSRCSNKEMSIHNRYVCDHCGSTYDKKPSLRIHIIQKHLNVLPYVCGTCGKRTSTLGHLRSHEAVHTTIRKIFECFCGAKMRTELGYNLHQRIHTGEKPYECDECGEKFLSASRRSDHVKRRHRSTKDMAHGCDICSARFVRPSELKKHYLTVHCTKIDVIPVKRGVKSHVTNINY